jgi:rubredoxin
MKGSMKIPLPESMDEDSITKSSSTLAFLGFGVRTSKILFVLFGAGLVYNLLTKKNATEKDAPNWSHVVTSKEQEAELHAFSCNNCGYTIFPARGREGKFFPDNFRCPTCKAPKESFIDIRDEVIEEVGEDEDYEYEDMDDYVGGDEALEKAAGDGGVTAAAVASPAAAVAAPAAPTPPPTPLAENEPASSPPSPPKKGDGDDLDVLGMDF